ncbi:MAG: glycosyltransferase [Niastella sp.]|uniref:glycosyltransferase n=1 Tax=Niastella sp. TaxID=1869183 RepID=UPI00389A45DA
MKVTAFSYIRNGFIYDYPFIESIQSVLPLCDEFIMVIGDSIDGTREAVAAMNNPKIKIIDTVWDEQARANGLVFAQQSNIGLDHATGDWAFHIQADEVIHEKDYPAIRKAMTDYLNDKSVDGLLFRFINFFGDYKHYGPSRRFHNKEIRIIRPLPSIRSYRDSQGFRKYNDPANFLEEKGEKLQVKLIDATVYHYSYVRNPEKQAKKTIEMAKRYHDDSKLLELGEKFKKGFDFTLVDVLEEFKGSHPAIMQNRINSQDWVFDYKPVKNNMSLKERVLYAIQKLTGKQLFTYKNYRII